MTLQGHIIKLQKLYFKIQGRWERHWHTGLNSGIGIRGHGDKHRLHQIRITCLKTAWRPAGSCEIKIQCYQLEQGNWGRQVGWANGKACFELFACVYVCVSLSPPPVCALVRSCSTLGNVASEAYRSSESKQQQGRDSSHCSRWDEICTSIRQSHNFANFCDCLLFIYL